MKEGYRAGAQYLEILPGFCWRTVRRSGANSASRNPQRNSWVNGKSAAAWTESGWLKGMDAIANV